MGVEIIHTVGPIYFTDTAAAPRLLASCYRKSLDLAKLHRLKSIAFPSLSTGIYGYQLFRETHSNDRYPIDDATVVAAQTVRKWLESPVDPSSSSSLPNASIVPLPITGVNPILDGLCDLLRLFCQRRRCLQ